MPKQGYSATLDRTNRTNVSPMIRAATAADASALCAIYNHYVKTSTITFEDVPVCADEMARRIVDVVGHLPWLVFEQEGQILGYAYATKWRARAAYRHTVESSVYVSHRHGRAGIGSGLYGALFPLLRERGVHTVIAGIALPNEASVAIHEQCGFRKIAHFSEVGRKFDQWIDVGNWQLML